MSRFGFIVVLLVSWSFLALRVTIQPPFADFDENAHVATAVDLRLLGGLPGAEAFPEIVAFAGGAQFVKYHYQPPLPYLLMAGVSRLGRTAPTLDDVLPYARGVSLVAIMATVLMAGLATRRLLPVSSDWSSPALVVAGVTLLPGIHSLAASATADAIVALASGAMVLAAAHALRSGWTLSATVLVGLASALVLASRTTAYPLLALAPAALVGSGLRVRATAGRLLAVAALAIAPNARGVARGVALFGDPLGGASLHTALMTQEASVAREAPLWLEAADEIFPEFALLTGSPWLWVQQSRALLRGTWIEPLALVIWFGLIVGPGAFFAARWLAGRGRGDRGLAALLVATLAILASTLAVALWLSARSGHFAVGRYSLIALIPVAAVLAATLGSERTRLRAFAGVTSLVSVAALCVRYLAAL